MTTRRLTEDEAISLDIGRGGLRRDAGSRRQLGHPRDHQEKHFSPEPRLTAFNEPEKRGHWLRPFLYVPWDQRGSNPHRGSLRGSHAAANTLIPIVDAFQKIFNACKLVRRESNPRFAVVAGPYKTPALAADLAPPL